MDYSYCEMQSMTPRPRTPSRKSTTGDPEVARLRELMLALPTWIPRLMTWGALALATYGQPMMRWMGAAFWVWAGLLALALMALAPRSAWPQTTMDPAAAAQDPWPAGLFFRSGRSDALLEAPGLKSDVVIRINGEVARTRVRQRFLNPADIWLEGVYVFPLPQGAAETGPHLSGAPAASTTA